METTKSDTLTDSFVVYPTVVQSIRELPAKKRLEVYEALMDFGMTDEMPQNLSAVTRALLRSYALGITNAKKRREASIENGARGGAPIGNQNARKQPKTTENNLNVNDNVNVNDNDNVNLYAKKDVKKDDKKNFLRHDDYSQQINKVFDDSG